jgi:two-component system, LytTR family, sensor kinase
MQPKATNLEIVDFIDLNILQRIQDTFAKAMGVAAVTVDQRGAPVTKTSNFCNLCKLIRSSPKGLERCFKSDADGGRKASTDQQPVDYICPGGLMDAAAPLIIEGQYVGAILCGQVIPSDAQPEFIDRIIERNVTLGLAAAQIEKAAREIIPLPRDRFYAAVEMLSITANYVIEKSAVNIAQAKMFQDAQERAALQMALKDTQLRALKAQINPHFLFNSLTLLGYTALKENASRTEEIVYNLSDMLRYSLRNISTSVELSEEVEMVRQYLAIQQIGFGDRLDYSVEIDPTLEHFTVPCMILQPLVENAVLHGAEPLSRTVTITVRAFADGAHVVLEIADDGVGMPPELVEALNAGHFPRDGKSLGLQNVIQRLIGEYEGTYALRADSAPDRGTRLWIYIARHDLPGEAIQPTVAFLPRMPLAGEPSLGRDMLSLPSSRREAETR